MSLIERTSTLLTNAIERGMSLRQIAPSDSPVDYEWLKKFSAGKIKDPSVNRIQSLHDHLVAIQPDLHPAAPPAPAAGTARRTAP